jgi:uncharacterized protein
VTLEPHRLAPDTFAMLAAGDGGAAAVRPLVAAQRSKHLLLVRALVDLARSAGRERAAVEDAYASLAGLQASAPGAVDSVLLYPAVGAWALRTVRLLRQGRTAQARPERLAAVAAAAAIRAALDTGAPAADGRECQDRPVPGAPAVEVPLSGQTLALPSLGIARLPEPATTATVRPHPDGAEIVAGRGAVVVPGDPYTDSAGWHGLRRLPVQTDGWRIEFLLDDLDPYRFPGMSTADGRMSGREADRWRRRIADGWRLLVRHHRQVAAEIAAAITVLTPLVTRDGAQLSATSREAFGCTAMSLPPDGRSVAVTLAHEVQHAKLAALMDMIQLAAPGAGDRFYAPWRPDPRPLTGLLHGAYAHTGVAGFWNRQRHHEHDAQAALYAHVEFAVWREASIEVSRFLTASGRLTVAGRRFVDGMLGTLERLHRAPVPRWAATEARQRLDRHRSRWSDA